MDWLMVRMLTDHLAKLRRLMTTAATIWIYKRLYERLEQLGLTLAEGKQILSEVHGDQ